MQDTAVSNEHALIGEHVVRGETAHEWVKLPTATWQPLASMARSGGLSQSMPALPSHVNYLPAADQPFNRSGPTVSLMRKTTTPIVRSRTALRLGNAPRIAPKLLAPIETDPAFLDRLVVMRNLARANGSVGTSTFRSTGRMAGLDGRQRLPRLHVAAAHYAANGFSSKSNEHHMRNARLVFS